MEIDQPVLIALGSNQAFENTGSAEVLNLALAELGKRGAEVVRQSRFFRTPCFPAGAGPDFVNAAAQLRTGLTPTEVLALLHEIESSLGRLRQQRWGARTVDLDLLAYGQLVLPDLGVFQSWRDLPLGQQMRLTPQQLILPHPRLQDRAFVLVPLLDIAPDWTHPVLGRTIREICADLPEAAIKEVRAL
ncbi:2-amino-4-hydroxy-6-hydroxymethyldihydropteridine diphosphokinase [Thalassobius sp. S69A]|uniref:2-amino-4-hydroxy-6- hydroxymethyldihydropteridine diphosphokinase n=1 Tax=unclassified Thalassovita TaxID=2619711 RepID=UPI000C0C96DD|nr:2-amino-4-hydroxy-6-hydroxymethyldihydropteridine diphosphokinase [Paracoccaceae bacterium]MBT25290.1 2-amino-4-hydroxy-6-hydroxymethyldihydropteridine diphosphokinase [Paracoccaceae bacterium]